jgi:hypothetical protein
MTPTATQHDLGATIAALGSGDAKGRRDFEAYLDWAKLERDWLTDRELEHLKRAVAFAGKRNRSLAFALERTKPIRPRSNENDDAQPELEKPVSDAIPANLGEMARELQALRASSEAVRLEHEQVALKLKTEFSYQAAWERRLEHAEDEVRALWNLVEELVRLTGLTAPRLEKVERRVGFQFLRRARDKSLTRKVVGD